MAWVEVQDYSVQGWSGGADPAARAQHYCSELEHGAILFFSRPPFGLPEVHRRFLLALRPADSRLHKNVSYRTEADVLRGFDDHATRGRVQEIMRAFATEVRRFVSDFLSPYARMLQVDYASFRPTEEEGRNLPWHKRNELLHVGLSQPPHSRRAHSSSIHQRESGASAGLGGGGALCEVGGEICQAGGSGKIQEPAENDARANEGARCAGAAGSGSGALRSIHASLSRLAEGERGSSRSKQERAAGVLPDSNLARIHRWCAARGVVGQFAMEQTFISPVGALVAPEVAPIRVLERPERAGDGIDVTMGSNRIPQAGASNMRRLFRGGDGESTQAETHTSR
jgi:3-deoxy-D-manno-oct-2-ulosonic acid (Kdo) hydroxylase